MSETMVITAAALAIDAARETERIAAALRRVLGDPLRRRGYVVAMSGGIDSSVTAALAVRAIGRERVLGLLLPERDSSPETERLSRLMTGWLGIEPILHDITPVLEAVGCYAGQDAAIREVIPEYQPGWKSKIVLPNALEGPAYKLFSVVVESPEGRQIKARLTAGAYLGILAATNFKQRVRKMLEYYHADRLNYAVAGTPNRLEYDQGFFVKLGDGAADVKPIAHLYKTQVYQLAEYLELPEEIRTRPPTTDTYSLAQSQEEFYFSLPYNLMDLCLYGRNQGLAPESLTAATGLTVEQIERVWRDIDEKRKATRYLHLPPLLVGGVPEIGAGISNWREEKKAGETAGVEDGK